MPPLLPDSHAAPSVRVLPPCPFHDGKRDGHQHHGHDHDHDRDHDHDHDRDHGGV